MALEHCIGPVCFFHLDPASPKIFGFAELLAGLALIVVAWTIADFRFKFRIATAPIPVVRLSSVVVLSVSVLALLTDLWRAEGWLVPSGGPLTASSWQFLLAALFLLSFFVWVWYAVISPPALTSRTGKKIHHQLFETISNGSPQELAIVADEVRRYAKTLAEQATKFDEEYFARTPEERRHLPPLESSANDIYGILSDRRLCKVIVRNCPGAAVDLFEAVRSTWRYQVPIGTLGRYLIEEGIADKDSVFYTENRTRAGGFIVFERSIIRTMLSDYSLLKVQPDLLRVDFEATKNWSSKELRLYAALAITAYNGFSMMRLNERPAAFAPVFSIMSDAAEGLTSVVGSDDVLSHESVAKLRVVMQFVESGVAALRLHSEPEPDEAVSPDKLDDWVNLIVVQVLNVAALRLDYWTALDFTQIVTQRTFTSPHFDSWAGKTILQRVRRRLFDMLQVSGGLAGMGVANVVRFCLTGIAVDRSGKLHAPHSRVLFLAVRGWLAQNFLAWHRLSPVLALSALPEVCEFDQVNRTITLTQFALLRTATPQDLVIHLR
ncbi:TPA: hypothetical protein ACKPYB_000627 [Stenotrophomonas maltophilia]|nr:hypothetical protein A7Y00_19665 [Stenotrophomonas maltophilia]